MFTWKTLRPCVPGIEQGTRRVGDKNNNNAVMITVTITGPFTEHLVGAGHCAEHIISELSSQAKLLALGEFTIWRRRREWNQMTAENPRRILVLKDSWESLQSGNFCKF